MDAALPLPSTCTYSLSSHDKGMRIAICLSICALASRYLCMLTVFCGAYVSDLLSVQGYKHDFACVVTLKDEQSDTMFLSLPRSAIVPSSCAVLCQRTSLAGTCSRHLFKKAIQNK